MIGGRVLDSPALTAFSQGLPYAQAMVWAAVAEDVVLAVPAAALSVAWSRATTDAERDVLRVLLDLPETVVEPVDTAAAMGIGDTMRGHAISVAPAQTIRLARARDWTVVTSAMGAYHIGLVAPDVRLDELP